MTLKISHSSIECYNQCSEKYRLRYRENLTSERISSPLFFGTAIDAALEVLLLKKKEDLTDKELNLLLNEDMYSIFDTTMREQNGVLLERNPNCDYFYSDFDFSVLTKEDHNYLSKVYPSINDWEEFFSTCKAYIKTHGELKPNTKIAFNNICWLSLYRKGEIMLKAYERDICPQIHRVYSIQKDIELLNDSGDILRGKIDFIASFIDNPDVKYLVDNKTASEPYKEDSVANSVQLSIYCEAEGFTNAAYAVMEKKIRSKEPKGRTQLIKDQISDDQKQKVFDNLEKQLDNIAREEFHKKDSPKECHFFGKKCPYYLYCWSGDMSGLRKRN